MGELSGRALGHEHRSDSHQDGGDQHSDEDQMDGVGQLFGFWISGHTGVDDGTEHRDADGATE